MFTHNPVTPRSGGLMGRRFKLRVIATASPGHGFIGSGGVHSTGGCGSGCSASASGHSNNAAAATKEANHIPILNRGTA